MIIKRLKVKGLLTSLSRSKVIRKIRKTPIETVLMTEMNSSVLEGVNQVLYRPKKTNNKNQNIKTIIDRNIFLPMEASEKNPNESLSLLQRINVRLIMNRSEIKRDDFPKNFDIK